MSTVKTWGNYKSWTPSSIHAPRSLEDLQKTIIEARNKGLRIRAIGALHSMNGLCETEGVQVNLSHLDRILWIDPKAGKVKVQAGITIQELLKYLAKYKMTLPNQGYIDLQTIGGAIATATHGSGKTGTLSSFVEEIDLVDGLGKVQTFTPYSNPHLFSAAAVHLGCLGIIYSVTLRCIPLTHLRLTKKRQTLAQALKILPELLLTHDYAQIALDPYSDDSIIWIYEKTDRKKRGHFKYILQRLFIKTLSFFTFDLKIPPCFLLPKLIKLYFIFSPLKSCIDESYKILSPADETHYIEEEIAIPVEQFEQALAVTQDLIRNFKRRTTVLILLRFASPDSFGYLSPAFGRSTAFISLIAIARKGYKELFRAFEQSMKAFDGRPHWGKVHFLTRGALIKTYGENYHLFEQARNTLDPERIFTNPYIDQLF